MSAESATFREEYQRVVDNRVEAIMNDNFDPSAVGKDPNQPNLWRRTGERALFAGMVIVVGLGIAAEVPATADLPVVEFVADAIDG